MTKRESEAERIFLQAVDEHAPGEWSAFLQTACGDDSELCDRVHALLKAHGKPNPLLEDGFGPTIDQPSLSEELGTFIGPYSPDSCDFRRATGLEFWRPWNPTRQHSTRSRRNSDYIRFVSSSNRMDSRMDSKNLS